MTMKDGFEILWSMAKVLIPGLIILGIIELVIAYITRAKEKVINKINTDISNKKNRKTHLPKMWWNTCRKRWKIWSIHWMFKLSQLQIYKKVINKEKNC